MYLWTVKPLKAIPGILQAFFLALFLPVSVQSQVVINEVMATNAATVANGGFFPDWVELYNSAGATANIGGYGLTDDITKPFKFVFPPNTLLDPFSRLVVWCDTNAAAPGFHTGFSLKTRGENIGLYSLVGFQTNQLDFVSFGPQIPDLSIGRIPDGPTGFWMLNQPTPGLPNTAKTVGPITNLFINEWVATNSAGPDWIELYNANTNPVALAGLVWTTTLPTNVPLNRPLWNLSFIDGGGFLQYFCLGNKADKPDELDFKLSHNTGETNTLYSHAGTADPADVLDRIMFPGNNAVPNYWAPDVSYGRLPDGGTNITQFSPSRATPAASNFQSITNVLINEVLSHTDPPLEDAIELYNPTTLPADISNWWLSNQKNNPKKFRIPVNTSIPAGGYKVFYEQRGVTTVPHIGFNQSQTGSDPDFTLNSAHGDSVYLFTADAAGNLTGYRRGVDFGSAENGVSFGRYLTSAGSDLTAMSLRSFGTNSPIVTSNDFRMGLGVTNPYPQVGPLVINEIMYHPPDIFSGTNYLDNAIDEYIEIYNITTNTVFLYDTIGFYCCDPTNHGNYANGLTNTWRLEGMVNFAFPTNLYLLPGESLLVVNFSPSDINQLGIFRAKYGVPLGVPIFGPYGGGKLKNSGGSVELYKPDPPQGPQHPDYRYVPYIRVDKVNFSDSAPWPTNRPPNFGPDGYGQGLQRVDPEKYGNEPLNWIAANPTPGWQALRVDTWQQVGNSLILGFKTLAGSSYSVQSRTNLAFGNWARLTNFNAQLTSAVRQVTNPLTNSNRFYRLVTPSQ